MFAIDRIRALAARVRPGPALIAAPVLGIGAVAIAAAAAPPANTQVAILLKARLPKTQISAINCDKVAGLCEVTAGSNLFYVDGGARFLIIGRVYDMETRQDITAARLLEMNPDMLVGGAAKANAAAAMGNTEEASPIAKPAATARRVSLPARPEMLSLSGLPRDGAIVWGNKSSQRSVTIFTDFRCGYCRALAAALRGMDVKVIERPISVLGSRDIADRVYCAKNQEQALHAAYTGTPFRSEASCDTSGLDANEAFAHKHGLSGTPVIVRSDGAMLEGYRPREFLEAWLKGAES